MGVSLALPAGWHVSGIPPGLGIPISGHHLYVCYDWMGVSLALPAGWHVSGIPPGLGIPIRMGVSLALPAG